MNGNGNEELPVYRKRMIEAANEAYQEVANERDDLERRLREMTLKYEGEAMKLEHMNGVINLMESAHASAKLELETSVRQYQQERDSTVRENARLEAVLTNCFVVLQRHMKRQD